MWVCQNCNQKFTDNNTLSCLNCGAGRFIIKSKRSKNDESTIATRKKRRIVKFETIRGTYVTWDGLAAKAAKFLSTIPKEKLLGISHSEDKNNGVIIIFYES